MVDAALSLSPWRNLVTHLSHEDPEQLLAHPYNWRIHDGYQRQAMEAALAEIGFAGAVIVNDHTGHVIDGHLRVDLAIKHGAPTVPVLHLHATEAEEVLLLATYDPLGALAAADREKLQELTAETKPQSDALMTMLTDLAVRYRPTTVSESFTKFLENEQNVDDDDTDDEDGDGAGDDEDEDDEGDEEPTSALTLEVTETERSVILGAIRRARVANGVGSSEALTLICRAYVSGAF